MGLFRGFFRGVTWYYGVLGMSFVSEKAQVELKSGRVLAPATGRRKLHQRVRFRYPRRRQHSRSLAERR
jgi:hypothetical protein